MMKKVLIAFSSILVLGLLIALGIGIDVLGIKYDGFLSGLKKEQQHEVFKESTAHIDGMIDDLSKYYFEFNSSEGETEKKGIVAVVRQRFSNFDPDKIEDESLKEFLNGCKSGDILSNDSVENFKID